MDQELKKYLDDKLGSVVTKDDIKNMATKDDLDGLATQNDFYGLQDTVIAIKTQLNTMEETLGRIDKRDLEDSNAFAKTAVSHDKRITTLEKDVNALKLHHTA